MFRVGFTMHMWKREALDGLASTINQLVNEDMIAKQMRNSKTRINVDTNLNVSFLDLFRTSLDG